MRELDGKKVLLQTSKFYENGKFEHFFGFEIFRKEEKKPTKTEKVDTKISVSNVCN